jgi:hypothetical protein
VFRFSLPEGSFPYVQHQAFPISLISLVFIFAYLIIVLHCEYFIYILPPLHRILLVRIVFSSFWHPHVYPNTWHIVCAQQICFNEWLFSRFLRLITTCCHEIFNLIYVFQRWKFRGSFCVLGGGMGTYNHKTGCMQPQFQRPLIWSGMWCNTATTLCCFFHSIHWMLDMVSIWDD